jgi:hypothetical protein
MSAPVTERGRTAVRGRVPTIPEQRGVSTGGAAVRPATPAAAGGLRRSAQQKAYARRDERAGRGAGVRPARAAAPAGRPQFVLLNMVLLAVGLVATLWLSTAAAADSYRLQDATAEARVLSERAERLHQEVAVLASAPELARRAAELGMTPVRDPARLVVAPDGNVEVVGTPRAAVAPPPPPPPPPPAGEQPPGGEGTAPEDGAPQDGAPQDGAPQDGAPQEGGPNGSSGTDSGTEDGDEDGTGAARLAAPAADAGAPSGEGGADAAATEGGRADVPTGAALQRSGPDAAGPASRDVAGQDLGESGRPATSGATETGPAAGSGTGGGGRDAG